jgi:hypothetical protein
VHKPLKILKEITVNEYIEKLKNDETVKDAFVYANKVKNHYDYEIVEFD